MSSFYRRNRITQKTIIMAEPSVDSDGESLSLYENCGVKHGKSLEIDDDLAGEDGVLCDETTELIVFNETMSPSTLNDGLTAVLDEGSSKTLKAADDQSLSTSNIIISIAPSTNPNARCDNVTSNPDSGDKRGVKRKLMHIKTAQKKYSGQILE